jgi:hypothetical protein
MRLLRYLFTTASFIMAGFLLSTHANAEVYKCTFADSVTGQNKVVYSDTPCAKSEKQTTLITIQLQSQLAKKTPETTPLMQAAAVDAAVTRAVLSRDFKLAKSLATTKEHWRLIAIAEGGAVAQPLIVANNQPTVSREEECAEAKYNFESASRISWRDKDLLAAKKSVMHVACGVPQPVQNQPIFVGRAFGGLHSGHWYHPNAKPHKVRPHKGVGHHTYPVGHHYHGRHLTGGSASLSYKSKHFSINADSTNVR